MSLLEKVKNTGMFLVNNGLYNTNKSWNSWENLANIGMLASIPLTGGVSSLGLAGKLAFQSGAKYAGTRVLAREAGEQAAVLVAKEGASATNKLAQSGGLSNAWKHLFATPPKDPTAYTFSLKRTLATGTFATGTALAVAPELASNFLGAAGGVIANGASYLAAGALNGGMTLGGKVLENATPALSSAFSAATSMDPTGGALALASGIFLTKLALSAMGMNMPLSGLANLTMYASLAYGAYKVFSGQSTLGDLTARTASPTLVPAPSMSPMGG